MTDDRNLHNFVYRVVSKGNKIKRCQSK